MESDFIGPVNIGSEETVAINQLAEMALEIAGKTLTIRNVDGPQGVRGRNSDNRLIYGKLGWKPKKGLQEGLEITYTWIHGEVGENRQIHK